MGKGVLALHVTLISHDDEDHLGVPVDLGLLEPAGDVAETFS